MTDNQRFYYSDEEFHKKSIKAITLALEEGRINEDDKKIINRYILEKDAAGISATRHWKLIRLILANREYHPPILECETEDILNAFQSIRYAHRKPRLNEPKDKVCSPLKKNTVGDMQRVLKHFFLWVSESNINTKLNHDVLSHIKPLQIDRNTVTVDDILTPEELNAFFHACYTIRDKAMFHMMLEGALRAGDIGNLQFKDLVITKDYCRIRTTQKTGKERVIPIISSRVYLEEWLNNYPLPTHTPDDFVFLNRNNKPLKHSVLAQLMKRIAARAGITKSVHLHIFRHTGITMMHRQNVSEGAIKLICWGNQSTNMLDTYSHLCTEDVEIELAKAHGVTLSNAQQKKVDNEYNILHPIQCPECGQINPPGTMLCHKCSYPLTVEGVNEIQELAKALLIKFSKSPDAIRHMAYMNREGTEM